MPLKRLKPEVKSYDLGPLRLWQDELAEIVRLVKQLPDVDVRIESDGYLLTDVKEDLPKLGSRVKYFTVTATPPSQTALLPVAMNPVIRVALSRDSCLIEATEPSLMTMGLIQTIQSLVEPHRRLPRWVPKSFFPIISMSSVPAAGILTVSLSPVSPDGPTNSAVSPTQGGSEGIFSFLVALASIIVGVIFGVGVVQHLAHAHGKPSVEWPLSIYVSIPCFVLFALLVVGMTRMRSLLFAATREEAPTFWQRKRSDIAINIVVGLIFFLLGLLTAHL
jgi:hypothetical protein